MTHCTHPSFPPCKLMSEFMGISWLSLVAVCPVLRNIWLLSPFHLWLIHTSDVGWDIQLIMPLIWASSSHLLQSPASILHRGLLTLTRPILITHASSWACYWSEAGLAPFCGLVIIALCMCNQLCRLGRQSRGTMTFWVQWAIAAWKQMTHIPRVFRSGSFSAAERLSTAVSGHPCSLPGHCAIPKDTTLQEHFQYYLLAHMLHLHLRKICISLHMALTENSSSLVQSQELVRQPLSTGTQ